MKIGGIIAEYNPFHTGHAHHIAQTRALGVTHLVAVMSGNFVQRGEAACFSKWARARAAIENGVDLVVELPTPFATAPATDFAYAGIDLLAQLGVSVVSFGSECGDVELLRQTSQLCILAEQNEAFQEALSEGIGHPKAREQALERLFGTRYVEVMRAPNNLLALEYLRAMGQIKSNMNAVTISRLGAEHDAAAPDGLIASASYLRNLLQIEGIEALQPYLPVSARRIFQNEVLTGKGPVSVKTLDTMLLMRLRSMTEDEIARIDGVSEGLENRIRKETVHCKTFEECVDAISSKRYTKARIRRTLLHLVLGQETGVYGKTAQYIRVLALNGRGKEILRHAKPGIPMSPKFADLASTGAAQAKFEVRATDLYALCLPEMAPSGTEFTEPVIVYQNDND